MDATETSMWAAGIAATTTIAAVLIGSFTTQMGGSQNRRRSTYGDALRTVVAWTEMPHRLRRRGADHGAELIDRFHTLQEDLAYHQGRIGSESKFVERSFTRLMAAAKEATRGPIDRAWADPVVDSSAPESVGQVNIAVHNRDA